ncbi:MAG: hypothetical protein HYR96_10505 [Deltaproteobacteria bacterium]|nr:hypothetical protein [Deltaproteobacteria bacterium]MBI3293559.1 hypothetical protein [Deltaproteobacteria bacterium]
MAGLLPKFRRQLNGQLCFLALIIHPARILADPPNLTIHLPLKQHDLRGCAVLAELLGPEHEIKYPMKSRLSAIHHTPKENQGFWERFFVRTVSQLPQAKYIENQIDGFLYFSNWFEQTGRDSYSGALREQHRLAAVGASGNNSYKKYDFDTASNHPDRMRHDASMPEKDRFAEDSFEVSPDIQQIIALLNPVGRQFEMIKKGSGACEFKTPIRGIPEEYWPTNTLDLGTISHQASKPEYLVKYIERLDILMEKMRNRPPVEIKKGTREYLDLIGELSDFYHTAINAMPFSGINNSLFMAEVNYILYRHGLAPVEHGWLDLYAFILPPESFRALFQKHCEGTVDVTNSSEGVNILGLDGGSVKGIDIPIQIIDLPRIAPNRK